MRELVEFLKEKGELKVIETPLDIELEIPHLAYVEVKKPDSKALLFTRPMHKGAEFEIPVLMNVFGSTGRLELLATNYKNSGRFKDIDSIASAIKDLLNPAAPQGLKNKIDKLWNLWRHRHVFPRKYKGHAPCQEVVLQGGDLDLFKLPILKTWEEDGGRLSLIHI